MWTSRFGPIPDLGAECPNVRFLVGYASSGRSAVGPISAASDRVGIGEIRPDSIHPLPAVAKVIYSANNDIGVLSFILSGGRAIFSLAKTAL